MDFEEEGPLWTGHVHFNNSWKCNIETHSLFINYVKAFDSVSQKKKKKIMAENGFPTHLIRQSKICTKCNLRDDRINCNSHTEINKGVRQGGPLSPIRFNIYIDRVIKDGLQMIKQNILAKNLTLNTILFADDQVIVASTEDELQSAAHTLNNLAIKCNLKTLKQCL
jgi:hypothetical protein